MHRPFGEILRHMRELIISDESKSNKARVDFIENQTIDQFYCFYVSTKRSLDRICLLKIRPKTKALFHSSTTLLGI